MKLWGGRFNKEVDSNFKGIYGYINEKHVDGFGWIPGDDFIPTERAWYLAAEEAQGKTVIVSPYLDAKTNIMMMSISKMLQDKKSVIGIDIALNEIQNYIEEAALNVFGYTFLVDEKGQVISHSNTDKIGKNYLDDLQMAGVLDTVFSQEESYFETEIHDKKYQVCSGKVMESWYIITVLDTEYFFRDVRYSLVRNVLLGVVVSFLIVFFYVYSFRRIRYFMNLEWESNEKVEKTNMKLIRTLVRTIDAKDRYTNGHSIRVAEYAKNIAKRMGKSEAEQKTIYYAGLLHDVGKMDIPLEIMDKPTKLGSHEQELRARMEIIALRIENDVLKGYMDRDSANAKLEKIRLFFNSLDSFNCGRPLKDEELQLLDELASSTYVGPDHKEISYLTKEEIDDLYIKAGTLSENERMIMQSHVTFTDKILAHIQFGENFDRVRMMASNHHELLNGKGYPKGIKEEELDIMTRILTIMDIFDSLIAEDRPYKKAKSIKVAFDILDEEATAGKIDADLLQFAKELYLTEELPDKE